jgi:putative membrane protein
VIENKIDAFFFALILSAVNAIIRPVLTLITLPVTILTLGLFTFVINFCTFYLATIFSYGVHFQSFSALFWGAFSVWVAGVITNRFIWKVNIY